MAMQPDQKRSKRRHGGICMAAGALPRISLPSATAPAPATATATATATWLSRASSSSRPVACCSLLAAPALHAWIREHYPERRWAADRKRNIPNSAGFGVGKGSASENVWRMLGRAWPGALVLAREREREREQESTGEGPAPGDPKDSGTRSCFTCRWPGSDERRALASASEPGVAASKNAAHCLQQGTTAM